LKRGPIDGRTGKGRTVPLATWVFFGALALWLTTQATSLALPFIGDDYVFLQNVSGSSFAHLWSRQHADFGWWRPWSREFHFWALSHLFGPNPTAFRVANGLLWATALALYATLVEGLASRRVAAFAALGAMTLALWGTPLVWISGCQDLWMLVWLLAALIAFVRGHDGPSRVLFVLALLSKETAVVAPVVMAAYLVVIERARVARVLARLWVHVAIVVVWASTHPALLARIVAPHDAIELTTRPSLHVILLRALASVIGLDAALHPSEVSAGDGSRLVARVLLVGIAGWLAYVVTKSGFAQPRARLVAFGVCWAVAGWLPLLVPTVSCHAYYACVGALGGWLALAAAWPIGRAVFVLVPAVLTTLAWCQSMTLSCDWGTEWYQRRAERFVRTVQRDLLTLHPTIPPHSRLYFSGLPNNIGFIAGTRSPAASVWYGDTTLIASFYSSYTTRSTDAPPGPDFFFYCDSTRGLLDATPRMTRPANIAPATWVVRQSAIAMLMLRSGDFGAAARTLAWLAQAGGSSDAWLYAAACARLQGDRRSSDGWMANAARATGAPDDEMRTRVDALVRAASAPP